MVIGGKVVTATHLYFMMRYAISGIVGGVIQLCMDYIFVDVFGRWYMEGVIAGFLVALVSVFILHKYWTFRDYKRSGTERQFGLYTIVSACALLGNVLLMAFFVSILEMWYILGQILTIGIVSGLSFLANTFVTFKR